MTAGLLATRAAHSGSLPTDAPLRVRFGEFELDEANPTLIRRGFNARSRKRKRKKRPGSRRARAPRSLKPDQTPTDR